MPSTVLRMREASFVHASGCEVGPLTFDVRSGERIARAFGDANAAGTVARLAAALLRPSRGSVTLDNFDSAVQPAQCKRLVGFVPHEPLALEDREFERLIVYRARLWGVDPLGALAHARLALERLGDVHEAFAYPIAAALCTVPRLLVLDRPQPVHARALLDAAGRCAMFSTHVGAADAAFAGGAAEVARR